MNYRPRPPQYKPEWANLDVAEDLIFASWSRALIGAKPENKLGIFTEMAKVAAVYADEARQQVIDDLQLIAEEVGLVRLLGAPAVQDAMSTAFGGAVT